MKVFIGPFPEYKGEETEERKIDIEIDDYDIWDAKVTMALVIVPILKKLREAENRGYAIIDDIDVPEELRDGGFNEETGESPKGQEKWNWAIDEMIWSFEQELINWDDQYCSGNWSMETVNIYHDDGTVETIFKEKDDHTWTFDDEGYKNHRQKMEQGRILFAKYFNNLWD